MKGFVFSLLVAAILCAVRARADVLFYGGDFIGSEWYANALANENDQSVHGNPYGAAVYQNFVVPPGQIWNVTGLFSNDLMTLAPPNGYWEIRSGLSEGNGGTLLASGTGADSYHLKGQYGEYTNTVSGLNIVLGPGVYWFAVVPDAPEQQGTSFNSNTFGTNSVGTQVSDQQYFNSPFYGYSFTNADNISIFPRFSSGVLGTAVPEPSSLIILGSGLLAVTRAGRRRCPGTRSH